MHAWFTIGFQTNDIYSQPVALMDMGNNCQKTNLNLYPLSFPSFLILSMARLMPAPANVDSRDVRSPRRMCLSAMFAAIVVSTVAAAAAVNVMITMQTRHTQLFVNIVSTFI